MIIKKNKIKELFCRLISKAILPLSIIIATTMVAPTVSFAQTSGSSIGANNDFLNERTIQLNATGSCDSTCDTMGTTAPALNAVASYVTRIQACGAGYTGSKTQTRTQNPDGTYTPWVDSNRSQCVCAPTYQDTTQTCASPLSGTFVQRTNWTCTANVGSWGSPFTQSSGCFTPCVVPATQYTSGGCPSGYIGAYYYYNQGVCPGGAGANSTPYYSGWVMYSNQCTMPQFSTGQFLLSFSSEMRTDANEYPQSYAWSMYNYTGYGINLPAGVHWGGAQYWPPGGAITFAGVVLPFTMSLGNGQSLFVTPAAYPTVY